MAQTIGEILKKARLSRDLSIADLAKETHIRAKYIEALEEDRFDSLPSAVHGRGFLRMLADVMELPANPLLEAWESGIVDEELFLGQSDIKTEVVPAGPSAEELTGGSMLEDGTYRIIRKATADSPGKGVVKDSEIPESREKPPKPGEPSKADQIFIEIGQILKNQRESLGLSLNDIEHYTHIRMVFLQSIEGGRINELPSTVQGKGMIESYAQFLDIDADELMLRYADGLQTNRAEQSRVPVKTERASKREEKTKKQPGFRKLITPDLLIGSLVIISLVIFAVWSTSKVIANRNQSAQQTIPAISEMLASTSSSTAEGDTLQELTSEVTIEMSSGGETTPIPESTEIAITLSITETATIVPFADNLPVQVYIIARQRAYLKVIVDDAIAFDGRINPGNAIPFSGNEKIEVITGNAAALQIVFNQNDLGTIGSFGQVVDLILTQRGVITPTPRFTPTATHTVPATITLEPTATPEAPTITPLIP